jgi:hypothetical protein
MSRLPRRPDPDAHRLFIDSRDVPWRVREIDTARLPNPRAPFALLFECDRGWRLVWAYPEGWMQLRDDELEELSLAC